MAISMPTLSTSNIWVGDEDAPWEESPMISSTCESHMVRHYISHQEQPVMVTVMVTLTVITFVCTCARVQQNPIMRPSPSSSVSPLIGTKENVMYGVFNTELADTFSSHVSMCFTKDFCPQRVFKLAAIVWPTHPSTNSEYSSRPYPPAFAMWWNPSWEP